MITTKQNGDKLSVVIEHQCSSCGGSGLYSGIAERNGCAVVCIDCGGSGRKVTKMSFVEFTGRKDKKGVKRVFQSSCGYGISAEDFHDKNTGRTIKFSQAGCTYEEWKAGVIPKPIEDMVCPYMHSNQNMQNSSHKAYSLYKNRCAKALSFSIRDCKNFGCKGKCWKRYYELVGNDYNEIK